MVQRLASFIEGKWVEGTEPFEDLVNPATEEILATTSTEGIDLGRALAYARDVGGPAIRALSFAERGALLEQMSKSLYAAREELIDLAIANGGNTRGDAKFDIDGATATLMAYAELGKQLGDRRVIADGEPADIAGSRLQGWHVRLPRHGVAVHIGAFNFPAWGWAEKAACALLAGMPVLTKPASDTALVAWRSIQLVVEQKLVPAGVLNLVCGAPRDLLDHLGWQDVVAVTGGSSTGKLVRGHQRLVEQGVRVNVEADSLNAALLVPGAADNAVDAFVRDVSRDMIQKTGQKCTAIRRVLVPEAALDGVRERLVEQLEPITVGNPALDEVRMGPLSTKRQLENVLAKIARLREEVRVAWGQPEVKQPLGVPAGKGFFVGPMLLEADDALAATMVHEQEVFGPVATLLPYDGSVEQAVQIVQRGQGGLVTSVYGDDRKFLASALEQLSPWHGRLVLVDGKVADKSVAPGTVLPQLLHGGPGRAGGGEELGGLRGLGLYQQRTAVQGNGPLVARLMGLR